jgi:NAD(P)-dependent dehydrogenase (short-subunit alcohol dehydrogenase family)
VPLEADVTDEASVARAVDDFGAIPDLLVNNAAITLFGSLIEQGIAGFRKVVDVNLMGTFIPACIVGRRMVERGSGVIVNLTSINAITPRPNTGAYPATKAAIAKLTEQMALEWGPHGVRVNSVAPGFIDAGMSAPFYADAAIRHARGGQVPMQRLGRAEDITAAVLFLASEEASYINGHQLVVDGGVVHSSPRAICRCRRRAGSSDVAQPPPHRRHRPSFRVAAPALERVLRGQGIESTVTDDIEGGLAELARGGFDLLTIYALRWSMRDEKYAPHRAQWALTLSDAARHAIVAHVHGGGGLLGVHTASICSMTGRNGAACSAGPGSGDTRAIHPTARCRCTSPGPSIRS